MSDKINPFEKKKQGVFFFKSSNPYEFYDLLNGKNMDDKQDVWGTLIFLKMQRSHVLNNTNSW